MAESIVLLTGFEPFGGEAVNPSWEAARRLDGWRCGGTTVHARRLPCEFGGALDALGLAMDVLQPRWVIAVGQAGGRSEVTPERVAINVDDARIPCNAGHRPIDAPVVAGAPAAYFSTLPVKAIALALRAGGIPASVSNSAGTFVCNHLFYGLMHRIATRGGGGGEDDDGSHRVRGGFVHVPYLPRQAARLPGAPSLALATVVEALRITVATTLAVPHDVRESDGQFH